MTWVAVVNWLIVALLVVLLWTHLQAILYFQRQEKLMGTNWVLHEYLRTARVFFAVFLVLTMSRAAVLLFSPPTPFSGNVGDPVRVVAGIASGVAFLYLGLKPWRQRRLFKAHEGRE